MEPQESFVEGFRVSPQQQHLWRLQGEGSGLTPYRCWCVLRAEGGLDAGRLRRALEEVVARNEVLRTELQRFPGVKLPLQVVTPEAAVDLQEIDLRGLESGKREARLEDLQAALASVPLGTGNGAPLVARLVLLAPGEQRILLCLSALFADSASLDLLLRDLGRLYAGEAEPEGEEPMQYADFAEWQVDLLESEEAAVGRAYWRTKRIEDALLPFEAPAAGAFQPASVRLTLEAAITEALQSVAERQSASLPDLLLACWAVLLGRLTERSTLEMVVGLSLDGRKYAEIEQVYGLLARVLPLEIGMGEDLSLNHLVARVAESAREAGEWQECFSWDGKTAREDGEEPFLPFGFEVQREPEPVQAGDVTFSMLARSCCTDRFKAKLVCRLGGGPLAVEIHYDASLLSGDSAERLRDGFAALLASALAVPDAQIGDLDPLGSRERRFLLEELNRTEADILTEQCIHHLFEAQAARTPEAPAVWFDGRSLTYAELNRRANQLARQLRELDVGAEDKVGLCCERSLEMVLGIVGILKAGAIYVPLDPAYPMDRLSFILDDTEAGVLLAQSHFTDRIPLFNGRVLALDADWPSIARQDGSNPDFEVLPDNSAYLIYTSGSTGKPKGVEVTHRTLVHSTLARLAYYREPVESFLLASSFAFDSSVAGIFWTLCQGGMLTLPPENFQRDLPRLVEILHQCTVSHLLCLPSLYRLVLDEAEPRQLAALREVIVAGEACAASLVRKHARTLLGVALDNEYGPTEATVWSTVHRCDPAEVEVPIGRPIANGRIYLLDARLHPVPLGSPGEIFIGGAGLTRGYLSRPELTAERFIPDPFSSQPGGRLYRTGDLGRYDSEGRLFFLGRIDHQVKIRGYRIELGEIEDVLRRFHGVRDVVVAAQDARRNGAASRAVDGGEGLLARLLSMNPAKVEWRLAGLEAALSPSSSASPAPPSAAKEELRRKLHPSFELTLRIDGEFVRPPRQFQRDGLLSQALNELADEIEHLHEVARRFVPGAERALAGPAASQAEPAAFPPQYVMEDWQVPIVRAMAEIVAEGHGDVLEIGFGRGVSASRIQEVGVRSHTIIEVDPRIVETFYRDWERAHAGRDVRLLLGAWQEVIGGLGQFDAILFHTVPVTEDEFVEYVVQSVTFAAHFFEAAASHLRPGGTFTYLTHEIDSLSRRHQRELLKHFSSVGLRVLRDLELPQSTSDLWWADSMVVVQASR